MLAGVHPGCVELFAHEPIRDIRELKGKKIASLGGAKCRADAPDHHGSECRPQPRVGDIEWVNGLIGETLAEAFAAGRADALLGHPAARGAANARARDRGA